MRTRRWLWAFLPMAGLAAMAACVGEDPLVVGAPAPIDAAGSDVASGSDTSTPVADAADAAPDAVIDAPVDAAVVCIPTAPQLFAPFAGMGTFCQGATNNHCNTGEHCCRDLTLNTQSCAASCPAGVIDLACQNSAECTGGLSCCGSGKVRTDVCTYLVVEDLKKTACQAMCSANEFQLCSGNPDCLSGGAICTPARALTPDNKMTSTAQVSACR